MIIHGKEREFLLTIGAAAEIAKLCPDEDLNRIGEVLKGNRYGASMELIAKMICIMSEGYEKNKKFEDPEYQMDPLTPEEIMAIPMTQLAELQAYALAKFKADTKPEVELEESKKEEGAREAD